MLQRIAQELQGRNLPDWFASIGRAVDRVESAIREKLGQSGTEHFGDQY
jgi:hypothetical protein